MTEVRLNSTLWGRFGRRAFFVPLTEPIVVKEALLTLAEEAPELIEYLFVAEDQLATNVVIFRNGRKIAFLDGLDTLVYPDDTLDLFPRSGSHQVANSR